MPRNPAPHRRTAAVGAVVLLLTSAASLFAANPWAPGARVIVDKAGSGHHAIVLRTEDTRCYVAYEGVDEQFDEWIELARIRGTRPTPTLLPAQPTQAAPAKKLENAPGTEEPAPEPLPRTLELPRPAPTAELAPAWLEQFPRETPDEPVRFNTAQLALPRFRLGPTAGIASTKAPLRAVLLRRQNGGVPWGFAAIEDGVVVYRRDEKSGFVRTGQLDLASLGNFPPEVLEAGDLNADGETDLIVAGGPVAQVFFGTADGRFLPTAQPYRSKEPIRFAASGRFFNGPLPWGLAVVEGYNSFRLLNVAASGLAANGDPYEVKFDRITALAAGDFDGDSFTDLALATENNGRSTGAWMYFNQRTGTQPFLWPVGGKDDFARDLRVADLDHDGRDDLILTDNDAERGGRARVVFGSAGRAGWEDPCELIGVEFGLGLGMASIVTGDFNHDGRTDIGLVGRNGLRIHLGADYRRFSRNPIWPRLTTGGEFPEQHVYLAADFTGDGQTGLLGYTPVFATGYNFVLGATPAAVAGVHVPPPLKKKAPTQASTTIATISGANGGRAGAPELRYLASRAEPYGQWRYRIVIEVAALGDDIIEALDAVCKYEGPDTPLQETPATTRRTSDEQWMVEIILPRGRTYDFTVTARDNKGHKSEPLHIMVNP